MLNLYTTWRKERIGTILLWQDYLFLSVVQSLSCVQLFVTPWIVAHQASLSFTVSQSLLKLMSIESVMPSNHLILCRPFLILPAMFPSIRVFSSESALCIRWTKYWSFSFSISPSNEYSGLISFRIDWAGTFYEIVNLPWLAWTLQFFLALCCWSLVSQNLKHRVWSVNKIH